MRAIHSYICICSWLMEWNWLEVSPGGQWDGQSLIERRTLVMGRGVCVLQIIIDTSSQSNLFYISVGRHSKKKITAIRSLWVTRISVTGWRYVVYYLFVFSVTTSFSTIRLTHLVVSQQVSSSISLLMAAGVGCYLKAFCVLLLLLFFIKVLVFL